MLSKIYSGATIGLEGTLITVEVDIASRGFPTFTIVGLPGKEINESKDRVRTALVNAGYEMPDSRLTVNLAPADIPKTGSQFDLPIAVGVLSSCGLLTPESTDDAIFVGELSLEGVLRPVPGVMPLALMAREQGKKTMYVPVENAAEAAVVEGVQIFPVPNLARLVHHLQGKVALETQVLDMSVTEPGEYEFDFADVVGQEQAKRALEIAAAGGHNLHMKGVPGAGKTMLSRAFPSILPPLEREEMLEVTKIYSVVGMLDRQPMITRRPFRSPHHTTSRIGLIGGGSIPAPGEISLAHRGVLFLDEFPEYDRLTLESLRQPMEDGVVSISRAAGSVTFPARFLLLAASNPCPCGYLGHPKKPCICSPTLIQRYTKRLSGPILDRIDIHIDIPPVDDEKLHAHEASEASSAIRERVKRARDIQKVRLGSIKKFTNAEMNSSEVKKYCIISADATILLKQATAKLALSARSYFKVIKVAQTIADLAGSSEITATHVAEALQYRVKEE